VPHSAHVVPSGEPHPAQNRASSAFSWAQEGQVTAIGRV